MRERAQAPRVIEKSSLPPNTRCGGPTRRGPDSAGFSCVRCLFVGFDLENVEITGGGTFTEAALEAMPAGRRNVRLHDFRIRDAARWTTRFSNSENLAIRGLLIENDLRAANSDGLHFTGCRGDHELRAHFALGRSSDRFLGDRSGRRGGRGQPRLHRLQSWSRDFRGSPGDREADHALEPADVHQTDRRASRTALKGRAAPRTSRRNGVRLG